MKLGLQQNIVISQQLVMTPQLQQAIKLLQMSRIELAEMIRLEIEQNPIIEIEEDIDEYAPEKREDVNLEENQHIDKKESVKEVFIQENIDFDIEWANYINEYNSTGRTYTEAEHIEFPDLESFTSEAETLNEHLKWQLIMCDLPEKEKDIGKIIIGNLNQDGYLCCDLEEIAQIARTDKKKVEKVLHILQTFDPSGVCARNLRENLLIQVEQLGIKNEIIINIIKSHLKDLENRNTNKISKALKISLNEVREAIQIIQCLEPRPGRQFSTEKFAYITPDIYVYKIEQEFKIVINNEGLPRLRISRLYQNTISHGQKIKSDAKKYLNEKMQAASWLIKSINQRQKTICLVMESILKFQREFFEKGISYLKPLTLKDIAEDIEMHESTVSRVTSNKYVHTPQGLFKLKYFFNSSVERFEGESMASTSVKEKIRQLIQQEDRVKPLSDDRIAEILRESNIIIARRTVAKYRNVLNILPSSKRRQF